MLRVKVNLPEGDYLPITAFPGVFYSSRPTAIPQFLFHHISYFNLLLDIFNGNKLKTNVVPGTVSLDISDLSV